LNPATVTLSPGNSVVAQRQSLLIYYEGDWRQDFH